MEREHLEKCLSLQNPWAQQIWRPESVKLLFFVPSLFKEHDVFGLQGQHVLPHRLLRGYSADPELY